ncbi:MAG: amino acid--tRNA ligase-related protein [bacterium]|nr:amino acid--tRNA ligase-related protein [bacterium]
MNIPQPIITRAQILRGIREFFWARDFLEVETPVMLAHPSQEPYLEPLRTTFHDERGRAFDGFLRMSPEFSLKKLLAMEDEFTNGHGSTKTNNIRDIGDHSRIRAPGIFEIGPVFRDGEPWGATHNPEFTMIEWYRRDADYRALMEDCEALLLSLVISSGAKRSREISDRPGDFSTRSRGSLGRNDEGVGPGQVSYQGQSINLTPPWERLTMREAWKRYAKLDLDQLLTRSAMAKVCRAKGCTVTTDDTFDDLFFKIHLTEVEPKLGRARPTFLTDWPTQMAGLARKKPRDPRYAERVELYIGGLELANGFSELTDADEQLARFRADQRLRRKLGKPVYPIDMDFIAALRRMPPTAGIALGVDRLVMLLTDRASITDVRLFSASELWGE